MILTGNPLGGTAAHPSRQLLDYARADVEPGYIDFQRQGVQEETSMPLCQILSCRKVGLHPIDQRLTHGVRSLNRQGEERSTRRECEECDKAKDHGGWQEAGTLAHRCRLATKVPAGSKPAVNVS